MHPVSSTESLGSYQNLLDERPCTLKIASIIGNHPVAIIRKELRDCSSEPCRPSCDENHSSSFRIF